MCQSSSLVHIHIVNSYFEIDKTSWDIKKNYFKSIPRSVFSKSFVRLLQLDRAQLLPGTSVHSSDDLFLNDGINEI